MIMGPLCVSLLNFYLGWAIPLYGQGFLYFFCYIITYIYIPNDNSINKSETRTKTKLPLSEAMIHKSVNKIIIICNRQL